MINKYVRFCSNTLDYSVFFFSLILFYSVPFHFLLHMIMCSFCSLFVIFSSVLFYLVRFYLVCSVLFILLFLFVLFRFVLSFILFYVLFYSVLYCFVLLSLVYSFCSPQWLFCSAILSSVLLYSTQFSSFIWWSVFLFLFLLMQLYSACSGLKHT